MARKKLTPAELDILYECWKEGKDNKERIALIEKNLPAFPSLVAFKTMRKMARTDTKWLKWATRQKNIIENEKLQKQQEKEKKLKEIDERRKEREKRRTEKDKIRSERELKENITNKLSLDHYNDIQNIVKADVFFCNDVQHYTNPMICIYRIFGQNNNFSTGVPCDKCRKMNQFSQKILEVINGRQEEAGRHPGRKRRKDAE